MEICTTAICSLSILATGFTHINDLSMEKNKAKSLTYKILPLNETNSFMSSLLKIMYARPLLLNLKT